jgi:hypothetical protein
MLVPAVVIFPRFIWIAKMMIFMITRDAPLPIPGLLGIT